MYFFKGAISAIEICTWNSNFLELRNLQEQFQKAYFLPQLVRKFLVTKYHFELAQRDTIMKVRFFWKEYFECKYCKATSQK